MKVQHGKDLANHSAPESCGDARESVAEALIGETGGSAIEPRNQNSGTPTQLSDAEGNTKQGDRCESWDSSARSETLKRIVREFATYYNRGRPHTALGPAYRNRIRLQFRQATIDMNCRPATESPRLRC